MIDEITIYPAPYHGPSEDDIAAAQVILRQRALSVSDQRKRTGLRCETCGDLSIVTKWTQVEVYETTFGPYERGKLLSHKLLRCPACGIEHRLGWAEGEIEPLLQHMKSERIDDD